MAAGQSTTCGVCGKKIETPATPLVTYADGREFGSVIDMDKHWREYVEHYETEHPDVEIPERLW